MDYDKNRNETEEDLDEDVKTRQELIEEAKKIDPDASWDDTMKAVSDLRRRWKKIENWGSAFEEDMNDEFNSVMDALYAKRNAGYADVQKIKKELIARAEKINSSTDWKKTNEEMNELMNQWKAPGSAGRDMDDTLWTDFNAARQKFYDRRTENRAQMQSGFDNAKQEKEAIILKAKELEASDDWKKTGDAFKELMEQWRSCGNAGRDNDDALWEQFSASRKKFNDARQAHFDEMRSKWSVVEEEKKKIVADAVKIASDKAYSRENTAALKELAGKWKAAGACEREKDEALWKEFRKANDDYFAGLRAFNEQKHTEWRNRMIENRNRKMDLIERQRRSVAHMQEELVGILAEADMEEMKEDIEDKQAFIKELEEQLADMDQQLRQK